MRRGDAAPAGHHHIAVGTVGPEVAVLPELIRGHPSPNGFDVLLAMRKDVTAGMGTPVALPPQPSAEPVSDPQTAGFGDREAFG